VAASRPLIVYVGAMIRSDAQLLFDSLKLLFSHGPDCQAVLIGRSGTRIPDDLKRSKQLVETGFVQETVLNDYMVACDVLLVPMADTLASRARWPSRVNPFLSAGRTVVMTRVGDLAALLDSEKAGVVTRCEAEDIVTNLIRLFDNPGIREQCEMRARHVAEHILAWPLIVSELEDLYLMLRSERSMLH
jgi:glycosyltransferase involved in cell wall biosynthesis